MGQPWIASPAVVFDMGGVLVELGPLIEIVGDDRMDAEVFWQRWLESPAVRAFEMGRCDAETFGERFVAELGLEMAGSDLVERFAAWPKGLFPDAQALVGDVRSAGSLVALLSNTNALHWSGQVDASTIRSLFDRSYLSYRLGMAKPDPEIFEHVIADLGYPPERIVFLDDNQANVDAARSLGIDARLARGVAAARRILVEMGLVAEHPS